MIRAWDSHIRKLVSSNLPPAWKPGMKLLDELYALVDTLAPASVIRETLINGRPSLQVKPDAIPVKAEAVEPTVSSVRTARAERASLAEAAGAADFDKEPGDEKVREPRPATGRRPMPRRMAYRRQSEPEDWAFAGIVTGLGATIGVVAAWLLRPRSRD